MLPWHFSSELEWPTRTTATTSSSRVCRAVPAGPTHRRIVIVIGDAGVGKSNLLRRFTADTFDEQSKATVGVQFVTKTCTVDGKIVKVQLWDTGMARGRHYCAMQRSEYCSFNKNQESRK